MGAAARETWAIPPSWRLRHRLRVASPGFVHSPNSSWLTAGRAWGSRSRPRFHRRGGAGEHCAHHQRQLPARPPALRPDPANPADQRASHGGQGGHRNRSGKAGHPGRSERAAYVTGRSRTAPQSDNGARSPHRAVARWEVRHGPRDQRHGTHRARAHYQVVPLGGPARRCAVE